MGECADAIINGDFDGITGEWLGEGQGFPRTMVDKKRIVVPGVKKKKGPIALDYRHYLASNLFKDFSKKPNQLEVNQLITDFAIHSLGLSTNIGIKKASKHVYQNKESFSKWLLLKSIA